MYNDTLRIASIHDLEHLTFLVLGLLYWDQVIGPLEAPGRLSLMGQAAVVLAGMGVSWALAVTIAYASHPLYACDRRAAASTSSPISRSPRA